MKVVTYLAFTVLSIFIQFCVMDFIQEKIQYSDTLTNLNVTNKGKVDTMLKNISSKPHALFYRTQMRSLKNYSPAMNSYSEKIYTNTSITGVTLGTTDTTTTILDVLYDENTSVTETTPTTESFFITTEFENVTEITLFENKNKSTTIPNTIPKISASKYCSCNLLYKMCDINCCCDADCTDIETKHFQCQKEIKTTLFNDGCVSHLLSSNLDYGSSMLESMFCIVKTNLPDKRPVKQPNLALIDDNKWKHIQQKQTLYEFKKELYKPSDPIWLLKNGTIYYLDFPISMINNYCNDRAPILFLKDEEIQCMVKLKDLEMFNINKTSQESMVISAIESTINSSTLNCSNLHCINWTILACNNGFCMNYNQSLHEVSCTEIDCINVALKIHYYFYYYDNKIVNATIQLNIQNISNMLPFVMQEVTVQFVMANKSLDNVVQFSGNPGYLSHLPVIISYAKSNHTEKFFNITLPRERYFVLPENLNGICVLSNFSQNFLRFGLNRRLKCRYVHKLSISTQNSTSVCKSIQANIYNLLGYNKEVLVSPFGNPHSVKDENWIKLQADNDKEELYGAYSQNMLKLHCFNLINKASIVFLYANVDDARNQNKILLAKYGVIANNASFNLEDISTVLTIDVSFVDATNPSNYVYAGSPHLSVHLPKDFFFPFLPNKSSRLSSSYIVTVLCYVILFK